MTKLVVMCNPDRLDALQTTLSSMGVNGVTVTHVMGYGSQKGNESYYRGVKTEGTKLLKKVKVEAVVAKLPAAEDHRCSQEGSVHRQDRRRQDLRL